MTPSTVEATKTVMCFTCPGRALFPTSLSSFGVPLCAKCYKFTDGGLCFTCKGDGPIVCARMVACQSCLDKHDKRMQEGCCMDCSRTDREINEKYRCHECQMEQNAAILLDIEGKKKARNGKAE